MNVLMSLSLLILIHLAPIARADFFPVPLITAEWLADNLDDVVILDSRKELGSFTKQGHIENAILVDVNKIRIDREIGGKLLTRMRPDPNSFQQFMRSHGINNDSNLVLTHQGLTPGQVAGAARLYWHLKYYNFKNVAMLDGGNAAWIAALEDLTPELTDISPGNYTSGKENVDIVATMQQVKTTLKSSPGSLVDTRSLRQHVGIDKKDYVYAYGHIPGSRNLPYKFLHPAKGTSTFFPVEKLNSIIRSLAINMNDELILYCNSAYECSSDWFVLHELLGHKKVRIYDGSLHQWTQYEDNPITTELSQ